MKIMYKLLACLLICYVSY